MILDQNIDRITVLINRTSPIAQSVANRDKHFFKEPSVTQAAPALLQLAGVVWIKPNTPLPYRFIGNLDPTFCHKIFDIAETKAESVVQPHGVADDS